MSSLRNAHVMSLIFFPMSIGFMSYVDLKKRQCRRVEFKGQGPHLLEVNSRAVSSVPIYRHNVCLYLQTSSSHDVTDN